MELVEDPDKLSLNKGRKKIYSDTVVRRGKELSTPLVSEFLSATTFDIRNICKQPKVFEFVSKYIRHISQKHDFISFRCSEKNMEVNLVDSFLEAWFVFIHWRMNELVNVILQILQKCSFFVFLLSTRRNGWVCSSWWFLFLLFHWFKPGARGNKNSIISWRAKKLSYKECSFSSFQHKQRRKYLQLYTTNSVNFIQARGIFTVFDW